MNAGQIRAIRNELIILVTQSFAEMGHESDASSLLAQAADLLRDAALIIERPKLGVATCLICNSGEIHILKPGTLITTLCETSVDTQKRVSVSNRVPTCPDCIKIQFGTEKATANEQSIEE